MGVPTLTAECRKDNLGGAKSLTAESPTSKRYNEL